MTTDQRIIRAICGAIDEVNEQLPKNHKLHKSINATLFDNSGKLDSMAFVSLIVAIEQKLQDECDVSINLADGDVLSAKDSPFHTVKKLTDHISTVLNAENQ